MNFSYGIIAVVGVLVAISLGFIAMSPDEIIEPRVVENNLSVCTKEWAPVCGVDGETYGNLCELNAAGVELAHNGECGVDDSIVPPRVEIEVTEIPVNPRPMSITAVEGEILEIESEFIGDDGQIVNHVYYTISATQDGNEILYEESHRHTSVDEDGNAIELFPVHTTSELDSSDVTIKILVTGLGHGEDVATPITSEYVMTVAPEPKMIDETIPIIDTTQTHVVEVAEGSGFQGCDETNECYIPYETTVGVGATITWTNDDTAAHTVTSGSMSAGPTGVFDSGLFMSGTTFEFTFEKSGTYDYFCMVHPWMTGIVHVE